MQERQYHPVSAIFPLMEGEPFRQLVEDVRANGLRESIWLHPDGQIIDGRNRYRACMEAGAEPSFRTWDEQGPLIAFVVSLNLHRRHLTESQRAMVGAKIANTKAGDNQHKKEVSVITETTNVPMSNGDAAALLNVHRDSISHARKVRERGIPEVAAAVEDGRLSLHAAKGIIGSPREKQAEALTERLKPKSERPAPTNGKATYTKRHAGRKAPEAVRGAIGTLVTLATGLDAFTVKDAAPTEQEAKEWERDLLAVISAVNRFRRQLKENGNGEA